MKKILLFLLSVMIIFSFSSCSGSDINYVKSKGSLTVGVTEYKPMDYRDENGTWVGFDAELAKLAAEKLGVKADFVIINWDEKTDKLKSKEIDCVWNGYTVNSEDDIDFSDAYAKNSPVLVVADKNVSKINGIDNLNGLTVAYEKGSSSERIVLSLEQSLNNYPVSLQKEALLSVANGEADACVVDKTIFDSLVHSDLSVVHTFESERFAVGFRKGSDLVKKINSILKEFANDGTLDRLAAEYKIELIK